MIIEKIIKLKDNKYKLIIDGESIITYDNVILDNNLLYNKKIDKELYKNIIESTNYYNSYNKAIKYILKRRRSENEILTYLSKLGLKQTDIESIINKLKDLKLINDLEYCRAYINDKVYLSNNGINKIRIDLLNENIPIEIIDNELNNIDHDIINNRLEKLILKRINTNKKHSNYHLKEKILNEMINLGYQKDLIIQIINNNIPTDDDILKHEFDKTYNKLNIKYNGTELYIKIKQKLLSRGFQLEKINKLLQEKTEE